MRHRRSHATQRIDYSVLTPLPKSITHTRANYHKFALYNIRSIANKAPFINDLITDHKLDYLCLTETWQPPNDFLQLNPATPPGFVYRCKPRSSGGAASRWFTKVMQLSLPDQSSFELLAVKLNGHSPTITAALYSAAIIVHYTIFFLRCLQSFTELPVGTSRKSSTKLWTTTPNVWLTSSNPKKES